MAPLQHEQLFDSIEVWSLSSTNIFCVVTAILEVMMMLVLVCLVLILEEDYSWLVFAPIQSSNRVRGTFNDETSVQYVQHIDCISVSHCACTYKVSQIPSSNRVRGTLMKGMLHWGNVVQRNFNVALCSADCAMLSGVWSFWFSCQGVLSVQLWAAT